jgi:hypothetical protein
MPRLLWNPKFYYRVHNSPPRVPILNHMHPVHTFLPYFPKIHLFFFRKFLHLASSESGKRVQDFYVETWVVRRAFEMAGRQVFCTKICSSVNIWGDRIRGNNNHPPSGTLISSELKVHIHLLKIHRKQHKSYTKWRITKDATVSHFDCLRKIMRTSIGVANVAR